MERLINGDFDLKEQTERDQTASIGQIMHLSRENKDLKKEVARLHRKLGRNNDAIETIRTFLVQLNEGKKLTEKELLSCIKAVDVLKYGKREEDEEEENE